MSTKMFTAYSSHNKFRRLVVVKPNTVQNNIKIGYKIMPQCKHIATPTVFVFREHLREISLPSIRIAVISGLKSQESRECICVYKEFVYYMSRQVGVLQHQPLWPKLIRAYYYPQLYNLTGFHLSYQVKRHSY